MSSVREIDGIRYQLYQAADLNETAEVQAEAFTSGAEPVMSGLQATFEQFRDFIRMLGPLIERDGLSLVARDLTTGAMVGTSIHLDMATENPSAIRALAWLIPGLALLDELDDRYVKQCCGSRHAPPGETLHFCWGAVPVRHQGRHIDQTMVDVALELAIAKKYRTAVVEASGLASQHIFRKRGFTDRVEIVYRDYVFEGRRPFASVADVSSIMLMDKQLMS